MHSSRQLVRTRHGVSLIELVTVIVIIGSVTAIAAPRYAKSAARYRADAAARQVLTDLELLRHAARTTSSTRTITFDDGADEYSIGNMGSLDGGDPGDYTTDLSDDYAADLVSADFGGDAEIVFDGFGQPDSGGMIVLLVGGEERAVTVDQTTSELQVLTDPDEIAQAITQQQMMTP